MSHRFKRPAPVTEEARRSAEMRFLARQSPDQAALDRILDDLRPGFRAAVFDLISPHLQFPNPMDRGPKTISEEGIEGEKPQRSAP